MRRRVNTARRILSLTIALLWILCCQAMAEINGGTVKQGEEFEIPVYVSANPNQAVFAILKLEYDHNAFELIPGYVQKDTASIMNLNGIPEGEAGKAKLRVLEDAKDGTYKITISIESADNIDENPVTGLEFETIGVQIGRKQAEKKREENKYYPNGKLKTEYEYDSNEYLYKITHYDRYGNITRTEKSTEWDASGNVLKDEIRYTNSSGKYEVSYYTYTYDSRGNRTRSSYVYEDDSAGGDLRGGAYTIYQYDESDHLTLETYYQADGSIRYYTDYRYDENDHVISSTTFNGNNNMINCKTDYLYDSDGNLLNYTVQDASGNPKEYHRQTWENGIMTERIIMDSTGKTTSQVQYDSYGDTVYSYKINRTVETIVTYQYNEDNYTIKDISLSADGRIIAGSFYVYNAKGQCIRLDQLDESGKTHMSQEYNTKGKVTQWVVYTSSDSVQLWYNYEYNEKNQKTRLYMKDKSGNVKSITDYEYNAQGQESKMIYKEPNGQINSYDVLEYNSHGDQTRMTTYYADGHIKVYRVYEYDSQYRKTSYTTYDSDGTVIHAYKYRYLEDGTKQEKEYSYNSDGTLRKESDWK